MHHNTLLFCLEMGAPVCFMLRFALFVPADYELESKPIQYTTLMPSMNEEQMRSADYSTALPFLITPGLDQDIDVNSRDMNRFKSLMDIFTRFPYEKKKLYFSTKDEYMAFFRWELEGTIQDSFYFPVRVANMCDGLLLLPKTRARTLTRRSHILPSFLAFQTWYQHTEKAAAQAEFRAKRTKVSNDHLALQDSTSDKTLGDRCFFGAGQRFMTPIKIPGLDEDYEFIFPEGPHSYHSQEHRDTNALRFSHKPRASDLLKMIYNFWPKEEKRNKKRDHIMPLARFKNRVAEIDFAVFAGKFPWNWCKSLSLATGQYPSFLTSLRSYFSPAFQRRLAFAGCYPLSRPQVETPNGRLEGQHARNDSPQRRIEVGARQVLLQSDGTSSSRYFACH